jgi:hypothetical protein
VACFDVNNRRARAGGSATFLRHWASLVALRAESPELQTVRRHASIHEIPKQTKQQNARRDAVTTPPTDAAPAAALTAGLDFTISLSGTFGRRTAKCWGDPSSSAAAAVCAAAPSAPLSAAAAGWRHACGLLYIV